MSEEKKELIEGINKSVQAMREKHDEMAVEVKKFGSADYVTAEEVKRIDDHIDKLEAKNDALVLDAKRRERALEVSGDGVDLDAKALHWAQRNAKARGTNVTTFTSKDMDEYKSAFNSYLRNGDRAMDGLEEKALSAGTDPDGGYTVHPDMSGRIVKKEFETSAMRAYASVQVISTDKLEGLYDNDESGYGWVSESGARSDTDTPEIPRWAIPVHEMYASPKATQRILDDSEINMEQWLAGKVADRFSRAENAAFVNGDGVGKPTGFLSYGDGTDLTNSIQRFQTGVSGGFAAAPNGADVLIDALYGLKASYRSNANWFMNRATTKDVRKLKDSDGAYVWMPSIAAGQPSTLLGYGVASFEDMPNIAAGSLSIAVGDMRQAYQVVERAGTRVLRDPYTNKPYVVFYTVKRTGGAVINGEALKIVEFAA